tara:strand:+ start:562 stop:1134 length:573 start_codon:yes stop_codon:yes gene_type:complete
MIIDWNIRNLTEEIVCSILLDDNIDKSGWIDWHEELADTHRSIASRDETHVADGVVGAVIEKAKILLNETLESTLPQRLENMNDEKEKRDLIQSFFTHKEPMQWILGHLRDKITNDYEHPVNFETTSDGEWHKSKIYKEDKQVCEVGIEVYGHSLNVVVYDSDEDNPSFVRRYSLTNLGEVVNETHGEAL